MIRVSTFMLITAVVVYLFSMLLIVQIDDFFLRMYGQTGAGSLYVFISAIALSGRYNGLDEVARKRVEFDRREREVAKRWKKRRYKEEQKKIKNREDGSP